MSQGKYTMGGMNTKTDRQKPIKGIRYEFTGEGAFGKDTELIKRIQLYDGWLWKKFVLQYRNQGVDDERYPDVPNGWRGEYWGKMMRGAALVCAWSGDEELYRQLTDSVKDMLSTQTDRGSFTTYSDGYELHGWDLWCRKYVLLGFEYYLEICRDEALAEEIVLAMCRHADYIMERIGKEEGKVGINQTTDIWGGLNSSSILEPYVRLYNLTGEQKYLDFSTYIVEEGGTTTQNIFKTAYEDKLAPYQYDHVKAYEMMSCFEGLIEYARATGNDYYRQAAIRFGYKLLKTDVSIIGCCGSNHELFDNTTKTQTRPVDHVMMQETCVTVTWMKLLAQLLRLTGDRIFADAMEQSFCNAYLGALNTRSVVREWDARPSFKQQGPFEPSYVLMPFDSYSPLREDSRCRKVAGLCNFAEDNTYYGCCAAIGAAGIGIMGNMAVTENEDGLVVQYYVDGRITMPTKRGKAVLRVDTDYPYSTEVRITVEGWDSAIGSLGLRVPAWSRKTEAIKNGKTVKVEGDYLTLSVAEGDEILLTFDHRLRQILPPCADAPDASILAAYAVGPVVMATDRRLKSASENGLHALVDEQGYVPYKVATEGFSEIRDARLSITIKTSDGEARIIDYSSAGKTFTAESACAVWIKK